MVTWIIEGQTADLTQGIEKYVKDLVSANWTETNPTVPYLGNEWWTDSHDYEIHFKHLMTLTNPKILGATRFSFHSTVYCHVFARSLAMGGMPAQFDNVCREVIRIIETQGKAFAGGIRYGFIDQMLEVPEEDNIQSVWHRAIRVKLEYSKVNTA